MTETWRFLSATHTATSWPASHRQVTVNKAQVPHLPLNHLTLYQILFVAWRLWRCVQISLANTDWTAWDKGPHWLRGSIVVFLHQCRKLELLRDRCVADYSLCVSALSARGDSSCALPTSLSGLTFADRIRFKIFYCSHWCLVCKTPKEWWWLSI